MKNDETLHKWINGELDGEELESFKRRPEYGSLVELYEKTANMAAPKFDRESMLADILKSEKKYPSQQKARRLFLNSLIKYAVAAAIVLLAGWFLFLKDNGITAIKVAAGKMIEGKLPDGSVYHLNAESELAFSETNWSADRSLQLNGEAFFSVHKGSKFTVKTANGSVQVLGTKFNVRSRADVLDVQCMHGKVAVLNTKGTIIGELNPFDAIKIGVNNSIEKYRIAEEENVSWISGVTKLRQVTIDAAISELERQYDITIKTIGVDLNEIISCNFPHNDLEIALKTSFGPSGLTFEIVNEENVILKNE